MKGELKMNKMNLFGGNDKSSKASFSDVGAKSSEVSSSPIQDENGNLTFNYNGKTYTVNVNWRQSFSERSEHASTRRRGAPEGRHNNPTPPRTSQYFNASHTSQLEN